MGEYAEPTWRRYGDDRGGIVSCGEGRIAIPGASRS